MSVKVRHRRGNKVYVIDILYRTVEGRKRRYRRDAQLQTRAGAELEERRLWDQITKHGDIPAEAFEKEPEVGPTTTFQEAVNEWRMKAPLRRTTLDRYNQCLQAHVLPAIGSTPLASIDFRRFLTDLAATLRVGRSDQTVNNVVISVRSVLRFRMRLGLMEVHGLPRLLQPKEKVYVPPSTEEVLHLLDVAPAQTKLPLALAALAGLRAGEIRGLRVSDVDLEKNCLVVRVALYGTVEDKPKSGHERDLPLAPPACFPQRRFALPSLWRPYAVG